MWFSGCCCAEISDKKNPIIQIAYVEYQNEYVIFFFSTCMRNIYNYEMHLKTSKTQCAFIAFILSFNLEKSGREREENKANAPAQTTTNIKRENWNRLLYSNCLNLHTVDLYDSMCMSESVPV